MSLRTDCDDEPDDPDDPFKSLAAVFARDVIRLREQHMRFAELPPDCAVSGLALSLAWVRCTKCDARFKVLME